MTVKAPTQFPNVLVEVFNQGHLDAVHRVAKHHGYVDVSHDQLRSTVFQEQPKPWTTIAHFGANAELFIFTAFTREEAETWAERAKSGSMYSDYIGCSFVNLRKVGIMFDKLNIVTESRDNQAVLAVLPRPKYEVAVHRSSEPSPAMIAPYGSNEFPECVCLGVDENTRKTCRMAKAYGGSCRTKDYKATAARLLDKPQTPEVIKWVRPKAENPIVTNVVRWLAVAGTKVWNAAKRVFNHLRGGL